MKQGAARSWLCLLPLFGVTVWLFWPWFLGLLRGQPAFFEWDVAEEYWPDQQFLCRSLRAGTLPYWNPFDRGGYPWYADPQTAAFHPLSWLPCVFSSAPSHIVSDARVVLSFLFAGIGTWFWLRSLKLSAPAALLGAVAFQSSPFMRHNWEVLLTFGAAHVPWILFAVEHVLRGISEGDSVSMRRRWVVLAVCVAMLAWSGSVPILWFGGSYVVVYALLRTSRVAKEKRLRVAVQSSGACVLAFLLASPVLIPPLFLAHHSVQAGRGFASIADGGLSLTHALSVVHPQSGNHLYLGLVVLVLSVLGMRSQLLPPGIRVFLLGTLLLGALFAFGDNLPFFRAFYQIALPARWFRLPYRYELWLSLSAAPLAAAGFDMMVAMFERKVVRGRLTAIKLVTLALVGVQVADVSRTLDVGRHLRSGRFPAAGIVVAARGERFFDEFSLFCRSGTRLGRQEFRGYQDPLILSSQERVLGHLRDTPQLLAQYGYPWIFTGPHFIHGWDHHYLPPPAELNARSELERFGDNIYRWRDALPRAYLVNAVAVERTNQRSEALLLVRDFAPARQAVIDGPLVTPAVIDTPGPLPGLLSTTFDDPIVQDVNTDALTVDYRASHTSLLVLNDVWYPGWRAVVDDDEVPIVRANALVRGVWVPPGAHRVHFLFRPLDGVATRWLWLLGIALCVLFSIRTLRIA